jgi:putative oxidoreductase
LAQKGILEEMNKPVEAAISYRFLLLAIRLVLGFLFAFAGVEKIARPEEFAQAVTNYHLLPIISVSVFAILLPWIELVAGLFLMLGLFTRGSSLLLVSLLCLFALAVAVSIARGLDISCGCFGTASARKVGWSTLGEDFIMLGGSLLLYFSPNTPFSLETYVARSRSDSGANPGTSNS